MEEVLERENLRKALGQVRRNKGAPGFHAINWESDAGITLRTTQPAERNSPDRWLADLVSHLRRDDLAHATVHGYRYDLKQFLRWFSQVKGSSSRLECRAERVSLTNRREPC